MISTASYLAVMCLLVSGLNDVVFKRYALKQRSRGMFVCGIGLVWATLQLGYVLINQLSLEFNQDTLIYGGAAMIAVTVSNLLLLECLGHLPISMGSTIYRLNTIPLVLLAFFFLGEEIDLYKGLGIGFGVCAVLLFYQRPESSKISKKHYLQFIWLILIASCFRALYGLFTKIGINQHADANAMILMAAIGWFLGGLMYAGLREKRIKITKNKLKYILISGVLVFGIIWLLTKALMLGDASIVVPLANMGFVAAFMISVGMRLETINKYKIIAVICGTASIVLLTSG